MAHIGIAVRKRLLLWQHDRNGGDANAIPITNRRGNAGHRIIGLTGLNRQALLKGAYCRIRKGSRIHLRTPGWRRAGAMGKQFYAFFLRQMANEKSARGRPVQRHAGANPRGDLKMAWPLGHGQHQHMVIVTPAHLHGFTRFAAQIMHFLRGNADEVQRTGIGKAIMVKPRAKPDGTIRTSRQHVLVHQIINDGVNGGQRCTNRLGNGVRANGRARFIQMIQHLQGAIHAADARAPLCRGLDGLAICGNRYPARLAIHHTILTRMIGYYIITA